MGIVARFCKKVVDSFTDVFYTKHHEKEPEEKCSYTLSSIFPLPEIEEQVLAILDNLDTEKEEVSC